MANSDSAKTYKVEDFIDMQENDSFTYATMALYMQSIVDKTIVYSSDNVLYDYLEEIKSKAVDYTFSDSEYMKYKYRPKLLAYDIYGSTELYFVILAMNNTCNIKDFNKRTIKMLYKSDMSDLLNAIVSAEKNRISLNRESIKSVDS